jgi:putative 4-mercaptohistidine N1-methyltranferase
LQANVYETDLLVDEYLLFHYGTAEDQLPYAFGPKQGLFYPVRCVSEFLPAIGAVERALDLGCAVGRSTFELSNWANEVIGIDLSRAFIAAANQVRESGRIDIRRREEGELATAFTRELPHDLHRERCRFEVGDATDLREDIGQFDLVLAANLIDRVKSPVKLLNSFSTLIRPGGHLILSSPYTWLEEFTPKSDWIGGRYVSGGNAESTFDGIKKILINEFDHLLITDLPFLIREHARKFQWSVAQATVWRRRKLEGRKDS